MAVTDRFRNWYITSLVYDVESTDTTIVINKALDVTQGRLIINPNSDDKEIVKITNVTPVTGGTQLTVERGDDGTLPRHHYAETIVVMNVTAGDLNDLYAEWVQVQQDLWDVVNAVSGHFVPAGGNEGQALIKATDSDWDTEWGAAAGTSIVSNETPSGTIDGSNTDFTTSSGYIGGTLEVYVNGLKQINGTHYTEDDPDAGEFSFDEAPLTGDNITVNYMFADSSTGTADILDGFHANSTPTPNTILPLDANSNFPINILAPPLFVDVHRSGNQSFSDNTTTTLVFNAENIDTHNAFDTGTGLFTVPVGQAGVYLLNANVYISSSGANTGVSFESRIEVNSSPVVSTANTPYPAVSTYGGVSLPLSRIVTLADGDVVRMRVYADVTSGSPYVLGNSTRSFMQIRRIY